MSFAFQEDVRSSVSGPLVGAGEPRIEPVDFLDQAHRDASEIDPILPQRPPWQSTDVTGSRIALFTGNFVTVTDGVSRTLHRLTAFLQCRGNRVHVFGPSGSLRSPSSVKFTPVRSVRMPGRPEYRMTVGLSPAARRRLDAFSPDLIHIATPDLLGLAALRWARRRSIPVVASYHTHFPAYLRYYGMERFGQSLDRYLAWFYSRCRQVYVPTAHVQSDLRRRGICDEADLWGRGVDCRAFAPSWRSDAWRRQHGVMPNDVLVTYVGRLVKEKDLATVASVLERLHASEPDVRSLIVGAGPLRGDLEMRLNRTEFTGHLSGADLSTAYASSDVFLFPSESEAFGNVIVESMASGVPVVCAADSGCSVHVEDGRTGLVAAPGNGDAFYDRVVRLVRDRDLRADMGRQARAAAGTYDWAATLRAMARHYDDILHDESGEPCS